MGGTLTGGWRHALVVACVLGGCGKPVEPSGSTDGAASRVAAPKPAEVALADCVAGCEVRNADETVEASVTTSACATWCGSTPTISVASDLDLLVGLRVTVIGIPVAEKSSATGMLGLSVRIDDDHKVWIVRGTPPETWKDHKADVKVTGILRRDEPPFGWWLEEASAMEDVPLPQIEPMIIPG